MIDTKAYDKAMRQAQSLMKHYDTKQISGQAAHDSIMSHLKLASIEMKKLVDQATIEHNELLGKKDV
jgi:creatinine amidohydrolase/Fe(II)-dependent formamide hydrolase-like protein